MNITEKIDQYLNEEEITSEGIQKIVKDTWYKVFPDSLVVFPKSGIKTPGYVIARFWLFSDKSEWKNGIMENDPLRLNFDFEFTNGEIVTTVDGNSLTITPESKHMAFGTKKLKLRKFKSKDTKDFQKKLIKNFKKVKSIIQETYENGEFAVHGEDQEKIIKSKL